MEKVTETQDGNEKVTSEVKDGMKNVQRFKDKMQEGKNMLKVL